MGLCEDLMRIVTIRELQLVPGAGIEPALANANKILSLACLPISPPGQPAQSLSRMQANQTLLHTTGD